MCIRDSSNPNSPRYTSRSWTSYTSPPAPTARPTPPDVGGHIDREKCGTSGAAPGHPRRRTARAGCRALRVLEPGIDTATAEGRAMFGMLSVLAELQRALIVANTRHGLAAARARGRTRRTTSQARLSPSQARHAQQLYDGRRH